MYSSTPINGNSKIVVITLNDPCANAIVTFGFKWKNWAIFSTNIENGDKKIIKITVPMILNIVWDKASLFAEVFAPITAIIAVIVVPMLSPKSTGNAAFKVIRFSWYTFCKILIVALEAWTSIVIIVPINTPKTGLLLNFIVNSVNAGRCLSGSIAPDINVNAKNIPPKPNKILPKLFMKLCFTKNRHAAPKNNVGNA